jgi:uroporphyrinogen-III synthase
MTMARPPLFGRRVVTTRDTRGPLDSLLAGEGADVVHVPLIEIVDTAESTAAVADALRRLGEFDWLLVTSQHGATRAGAAAAEHPGLRLGAVGGTTAATLAELAGRPVDVLPGRQTAADLAAAMPEPSAGDARHPSVLIAQADRADATLADALSARGFDVEVVTAYVTALRAPTAAERVAVSGADAVVFASGSAVRAWAAAFGTVTPPVVISIGPATTAVATQLHLKVTHEAADHHLEGLVTESIQALTGEP